MGLALHRKTKTKKLKLCRVFSPITQLTFTCSKSTIETVQKGGKDVQS